MKLAVLGLLIAHSMSGQPTTYASYVSSHFAGAPVLAACSNVQRSQLFDTRVVLLSRSDCADIAAARKLGPKMENSRFLLGPWNLLHETGHVEQDELGLTDYNEHDAECRALRMFPAALPLFGIRRGTGKFHTLVRQARAAVLSEEAPYGGAC